ncbi:unnamed protein product, partial [Scytosiphon promiscuus]
SSSRGGRGSGARGAAARAGGREGDRGPDRVAANSEDGAGSGGGGSAGGGSTAGAPSSSSPSSNAASSEATVPLTLPAHDIGPGSLPYQIGALYTLYCLHGTQASRSSPVPVRVSPAAMVALMRLRWRLKAAGPRAIDALAVMARLVLGDSFKGVGHACGVGSADGVDDGAGAGAGASGDGTGGDHSDSDSASGGSGGRRRR